MKDFIPYEQALELKELGFDEPCIGNYFHTKELKIYGGDVLRIKNSDMGTVTAPTFSQAFTWFREEYDLFGVVEGKGYDHKKYYIYSINGKWHPSQPSFDKPEEAELECLIKLIEIVKTK
jgi:hypothetical protein